jgi:DNA-binding NtrC family response regulator
VANEQASFGFERMSDTLIIIDDDAEDTELLILAIRNMTAGYRCMAFTQPEDAIEYILSTDKAPAGIILDLHMPRITGVDCLRRFYTFTRERSIPVVVQSSATPSDLILDEIERLGARFMLKPHAFDDYKLILKHLFLSNAIARNEIPG